MIVGLSGASRREIRAIAGQPAPSLTAPTARPADPSAGSATTGLA